MGLVIAFAIIAALIAADIDANKIDIGVEIDHRQGWIIRAIAVTLFGLAWAFVWHRWGRLPLTLLACACLFSLVFRLRLNEMRKLDWDYVNGTNYYDAFWIMTFGANAGIAASITEFMVAGAAVIINITAL